jgi:hypothetical protein
MVKTLNTSRRLIMMSVVNGSLLACLVSRTSQAGEATLVSEEDPAAKALNYVEDVARSKNAKPGSKCANCSLYSGDSKSTQASCAVFGTKLVRANGWCSAWTNM